MLNHDGPGFHDYTTDRRVYAVIIIGAQIAVDPGAAGKAALERAVRQQLADAPGQSFDGDGPCA